MPNTPPSSPPSPAPLPSASAGNPAAGTPRNEYTVDELARVTDTTVRNVRAYQDRGLLAPPEKRGRVGVYDDTHVSRLKLINHLLTRGYTLANIQDLIMAVDEGHDLRSILGLETAIGGRWSRERPKKYSLIELLQMFGDKAIAERARQSGRSRSARTRRPVVRVGQSHRAGRRRDHGEGRHPA